jgi:hypothetical protein
MAEFVGRRFPTLNPHRGVILFLTNILFLEILFFILGDRLRDPQRSPGTDPAA